MSLDLRPLLTPSFWFDLGPQPPSDAVSNGIFIAFGLLLVVGVAARLLRRRAENKLTRVLIRRASGIAIWAAVTGLVWFFCHYERVRFLGSRFWFLLWIGLTVFALVRFVRFVRRDVPAMRARQEERAAK
jgi:uncharacterized membrane protein